MQQVLHQGLPAALFDLPFTPLFLAIMFMIHPVLGLLGVAGGVALVALAVLTERRVSSAMKAVERNERRSQTAMMDLVRQSGTITGLGMADPQLDRWRRVRAEALYAQLEAGEPANLLGAASRSLRLTLQIAVLGVGALLAVRGELSPGAIIAGSIILARGLAPIDMIVNGWRPLVMARQAIKTFDGWLPAQEATDARPVTPMPRPAPEVRADQLAVAPPGAERAWLQPFTHHFGRGHIVVLLGGSGSGKTSLLSTLAGVWDPFSGDVSLGSRLLSGWQSQDRGRFFGYLPQNPELLAGSVFDNICRFQPSPEDQVYNAARQAGCHELILSLPQGYDTQVGEGQPPLSPGQKQAIGLARALYGDPALLLFDEPTAHLDSKLTAHALQWIGDLARQPAQTRSMTTFIATHDPRILTAADEILIIKNGQVMISPRDVYMDKVAQLKRGPHVTATVHKPGSSAKEQTHG